MTVPVNSIMGGAFFLGTAEKDAPSAIARTNTGTNNLLNVLTMGSPLKNGYYFTVEKKRSTRALFLFTEM
jgi:hypothetical protein